MASRQVKDTDLLLTSCLGVHLCVFQQFWNDQKKHLAGLGDIDTRGSALEGAQLETLSTLFER